MGLIGKLLGALLGGGRNVIRETAEVFRPNAEAADQRSADAQGAALQQMAAEFGGGNGWFHGLVNGLNRLPRPLIAFGVLALFLSAMVDPVWFAARMEGLTLVPEQLWTLMGIIVAFYFGAREMHKLRSGAMAKEAARIHAQTPRVVENIRSIEALRADSPGAASAGTDAVVEVSATQAGNNPALEEWRSQRSESDR
mgnify:CR=1 FL=1